MGQLDGKVAIVTGSGRGIGQQVALRLARDEEVGSRTMTKASLVGSPARGRRGRMQSVRPGPVIGP